MAEFAITNLYVDKVDEDKLVEEAIIKMLAQLDPHSTYSDAEEVKKMNEPLQGNFEGIVRPGSRQAVPGGGPPQRLRGGAGDWQQQKTGGARGGAGCHGKAVSSGTVRRNACETVESHTCYESERVF